METRDFARKTYFAEGMDYVDYMRSVPERAISDKGAIFRRGNSKKPYKEYFSYGQMLHYFNSRVSKQTGWYIPSLSDPYVTSSILYRPIPEQQIITNTIICYPLVNGDDVHTNSVGEFLDVTYLVIGESTVDNTSYLRFPGVAINKGDNIVSAILEVTSFANYTSAGCVSWIFGNKVVNASAPTNYADAQAKQATVAYQRWGVGDWSGGVNVKSPDIFNIVQEIVDLGGWVKNNALMLILPKHPDCTAGSWRAFRGHKLATLTITFETILLK